MLSLISLSEAFFELIFYFEGRNILPICIHEMHNQKWQVPRKMRNSFHYKRID